MDKEISFKDDLLYRKFIYHSTEKVPPHTIIFSLVLLQCYSLEHKSRQTGIDTSANRLQVPSCTISQIHEFTHSSLLCIKEREHLSQ